MKAVINHPVTREFLALRGLIGPTRRTVLGPLAIENAAGRSVAPARTSFDPAQDFYRPTGSSVREGLKGGQVLITDVPGGL